MHLICVVRENLLQSNQIIPPQDEIITFNDIKKRKPDISVAVWICNDRYDIKLHAIELASMTISQKLIYHPIIFLQHKKVTKEDKLLLALHGLALSYEQKEKPTYGKFITGDKFSISRVQLPSLYKNADKIEKEIIRMMDSQAAPLLRIIDNCKICEFQKSCYATAKEKNDLSLLKGLSGKEIDMLNKRGIFTVTQYSYTFRPRRASKLQAIKIIKHHHSLNALAIRTRTIYIGGNPELPSAKARVFLDVEGIPDENCFYLIGLLIDDRANITMHSLWADNKSEEISIWKSFLEIIATLDDFALLHYGSYEIKFIR